MSIFKLAASGYSVLWNPPQDPSSPSLIPLVDGEPCFQCPTCFCKVMPGYSLWFCTLKPSSRPFLPIFNSSSDGELERCCSCWSKARPLLLLCSLKLL
jgi:hypothetical protein